MSRPDDRVAVPTNGHQPTQSTEVVDRPIATVRPAQLAAGFGIIAALIVLAIRRRRGRKG